MACPFLAEGRARYCHAAPVRKLILDGPGVIGGGRCDSTEYLQCSLAVKNTAQAVRCPHLEEVRVQYCGASAVTTLVPFSDSQLSSCTTGSHRYCDSYLALARPHPTALPSQLLYAPNHFWLDTEESGLCHIGIDLFLADAAGSIDGLTFVTMQGIHCPALALTIHGLEWPMSFPNPMIIQKVNGRVRSDPSRLTADPYGAGWLFEGWELPGRTRAGLVSGPQAMAWQSEERERLKHQINETGAWGGDRGVPVRGPAELPSRQHLVCLFQQFFSKTSWAAEG
jgi:glycine cleavage system H lipoate-binding protein